MLHRVLTDERGSSTTERAVIAGVMVLVALMVWQVVGAEVQGVFEGITAALERISTR